MKLLSPKFQRPLGLLAKMLFPHQQCIETAASEPTLDVVIVLKLLPWYLIIVFS